jgi:hypothetical protein
MPFDGCDPRRPKPRHGTIPEALFGSDAWEVAMRDAQSSSQGRTAAATLRWLAAVALVAGPVCVATATDRRAEQLEQFARETGLAPVEVPGTGGEYLGKTHRGYRVLFTAKAGDVWGRYAARLAMGEIGHEVGGMLAYLTGSQEWGSGAAGSPLDRLLAQAIGQPLSVSMVLEHGRAGGRLDVYPGYAVLKPETELPEVTKLGGGPGSLRSADTALAERIMQDGALVSRLRKLRGAYLRVDDRTVGLYWSGQEKDYSAMIRGHGGYWKMINAWLDDLADVADALPSAGAP